MEEKEYGFHKLEVNQKIRVFKNTYNDRTFYRFQTSQKNFDGTTDKYYIPLTFKRNINLPNETDIVVKQFVENCRKNPKDPYSPIHYYQINKFEIVESQEQKVKKAYDEFRDNLDENENFTIDENFLD